MKNVIIFGASGYGLDALYSLDDIEFRMLCFINNNKEIQGNKYYGYIVDSSENIHKYDFDYIILPISDYAEDMKNQLKYLLKYDFEVGRV